MDIFALSSLYIGSHLQSLNTSPDRDKHFSPHKVPYFMSLTDILSFTSSFLWNSLLVIRLQPSARASLPANLTASAASPCGELWVMGVNEPDWLLLGVRNQLFREERQWGRLRSGKVNCGWFQWLLETPRSLQHGDHFCLNTPLAGMPTNNFPTQSKSQRSYTICSSNILTCSQISARFPPRYPWWLITSIPSDICSLPFSSWCFCLTTMLEIETYHLH